MQLLHMDSQWERTMDMQISTIKVQLTHGFISKVKNMHLNRAHDHFNKYTVI